MSDCLMKTCILALGSVESIFEVKLWKEGGCHLMGSKAAKQV